MKTTQEKIEVMQAFLDGKTVQMRYCNSPSVPWFEFNPTDVSPTWDWGRFDFQIKKEPREFWILVDKYGCLKVTQQDIMNSKQVGELGYVAVIKVREVL